MPNSPALPPFTIAADAAPHYAGWLAHLAHARRLSPHTVAAYGRDVRDFFGFLQAHLGGQAGLAELRGPANFGFPRLAGASAGRWADLGVAGAGHFGGAQFFPLFTENRRAGKSGDWRPARPENSPWGAQTPERAAGPAHGGGCGRSGRRNPGSACAMWRC